MGENSSTTPASGGTHSPRSKSDALKPEASAREIPPKPDAQQASDPLQPDVPASTDPLPSASGPPPTDGIVDNEDESGPVEVLPPGMLDTAGTLEIGPSSFAVCSVPLSMHCGGCILDLSGSALDLGAGVSASARALVVPASAGSGARERDDADARARAG